MAVFNDEEVANHALDYCILRDGGISLYWRPEFLEEDASALSRLGYRVVMIDCGTWTNEAALHIDLAKALSFPAYYGGNFDALSDCLCNDIEVPELGGLVLGLRRMASNEMVRAVLDVCARASREWTLVGKRFLVLAQTSDPVAEFGPLGAVRAQWNRREFLDSTRMPG